jgi:hypothetical protein
MAKQEVNIGVEGNDGTGDSIREAFRKVNENFNEVYAIFGLGGQISFTSLNDTPGDDTSAYLSNEGSLVAVKQDATGLDFYELVSNAGTNDPNNPENTIAFSYEGNKLKITAVNTRLATDPSPSVAAPLRVGAAAAYNNLTNGRLIDDAQIGSLVSDWNAIHGGSGTITADNLLISKGYGDAKYVNVTGDTLTGALSVPAGATGNQVPRVSEVVRKIGDTMTGPLFLHDHPAPFAGAGTPNSVFDLQAATKFYVDSSSTSSTANLYVTQAGDDTQAGTPPGKAGRSTSYSYRSIAAACEKAELIQKASAPDLGPYVQNITYTESLTTFNSYVVGTNVLSNPIGYSMTGTQLSVYNLINTEKADIINDTIVALEAAYPDFAYNETTCRRDLGLMLDSIRYDIGASTTAIKHNYMSRYAGLRYYSNPSGELAISTNGQYTQTVYAINFARATLLQRLTTAGISGQWFNAVDDRFDDIISVINGTIPSLVESTNYYNLYIYSGANKFVDQSGNPSLDRPNIDLFPGKAIRGVTSKAIAQVITYKRGIDTVGAPTYDTAELQLITPQVFLPNEELEFGDLVKFSQIKIIIESGIYEEQLPIRVPENTSIEGDELRRVIIRPAEGVSTSPYARTYFYRDATIDGLVTATGGDLAADPNDSSTVGYYGYHYLTDPANPNSTPKLNKDMDVFLMNDSTILRSLTCQRHGGFMAVLDPTGNIQTKSPYIQTCTSFSGSINKKAFRGGMFIDGYVYNMPMTVVFKDDNFTLNVEAPSTSGLGVRKPRVPCSFFINGTRYQVNAIKDYTPNVGGIASATLILDETSNNGNGFVDDINSPLGPVDIVLQGAGNKSMLANDYTHINDLGYGVIATNNSLSELVSVFTYYCHTGYYALNGAQVRSLTGNNSYGTYGLVAEGSDPDEVANLASLAQPLVQPVKVYVVDQEVTVSGDQSALLTVGEQISQTQVGVTVTGYLAFYQVTGGNTILHIERVTGGSFNALSNIFESTPTSLGAPTNVVARSFTGNVNDVSIYVYDLTYYPLNASEIEIVHDSGLYQPYEVVSVSDSGITIPAALESTLCDSTSSIRGKIWRLDLSSGVATADTGLQEVTRFGTLGVYRAKQNFLFNGITSDLLTRPSTSLIFDEYATYTYRTISFESTIVGSIPAIGEQAKVTVDDNFAYIDLLVDNDRADYALGVGYSISSTIGVAPTVGTTLGRTVGDRNIVISRLSTTNIARILGKEFTWAGKTHVVTGYTEIVDTSGTLDLDGNLLAIVTFNDVYSIHPTYVGTGLAARADSAIGDNISIKAGLPIGSTANITVNISTCRATSHDFLDIGTGGYNSTNYPDRIYGAPINSPVTDEESIDSIGFNAKAQVQERVKGRVFFASTDQDGFFRVGRFFTVDQGTGRVTFNAALVLTNIDGIGFKRGVRVNEFSPDTTFTNATGDSVPTETAVEGYINRRLGWDRDGDFISGGDIIGGGAIRKAGDIMTGALSMGGNQITNLATPTTSADAATKGYVDGLLNTQNELSELDDVNITSIANGNFLVYDSVEGRWVNRTPSSNPVQSDITFTYSGGVLAAQINAGAISNSDVSASAGISQSKLTLNAATTRINATGITQGDLGVASFNSATFNSTSGWIDIATNGVTNAMLAGSIANNKLANSTIVFSNGTTSAGVSLGGTLTINGTTNEIDVAYTAGAFTLSLPATISADITGSAGSTTNATNAANVGVIARNTANAIHYPLFTTAVSGNLPAYTDNTFTWNPGTNTMVISGTTNLSFTLNAETGSILPRTNNPIDSGQSIGSSTNRWNTVFATTFNGTATNALYADLAENYLGDADYEPGTVLIFGGEYEVTVNTIRSDRRVAGVVTTNPAHLMNSALEGKHVVGLALQGRVPCKVLGRVQKGDLIVTSAIPGYGIVDNNPPVGTVIGKAVSEKLNDSKGVVEIVVGRV